MFRSLPVALAALAGCLPAAHAVEPRTGEAVYQLVCHQCHANGEAGAPKFGDKVAWKPLIAEGQPALSRTAIKGIRKMPAKGGRPDLSELEVRRAVAYIANAGGAKWAEPAR